MKSVFALFFLLTFSFYANGQRETTINSEIWYGLMTSGQVAPNWSIWLDSHFVPELFLILRSGLTYHTSDQKVAITGGYATLRLTTPFSQGQLIRPEHRPWGQVVYRIPTSSNFSVSLRYRHDMRYRAQHSSTEFLDGYWLNHRMRFNASMRYNWRDALSPHFNFSTTLFNETLITTGPDKIVNPFEHRVFVLFSFHTKSMILSPGYHIRFTVPEPGSNKLNINHGLFIWINLNYKFKDFRRHTLKEYPGDHI